MSQASGTPLASPPRVYGCGGAYGACRGPPSASRAPPDEHRPLTLDGLSYHDFPTAQSSCFDKILVHALQENLDIFCVSGRNNYIFGAMKLANLLFQTHLQFNYSDHICEKYVNFLEKLF